MTEPLNDVRRRHTIAEYLALEEAAEERHEFHDGEILAMSGGTYTHARITTNLLIALGSRLRNAPCQPLGSDMRFRVASQNRYVYPDVTVVCGPPEFDPNDRKQTTLLNPRLIVEVLSESTQAYDRGEKFDAYRTVTSLQEYVLVEQASPRVQTYLRQPDGSWRFDAVEGLEATVMLRSLDGLHIALAEIYSNVVFPPPSAPSI